MNQLKSFINILAVMVAIFMVAGCASHTTTNTSENKGAKRLPMGTIVVLPPEIYAGEGRVTSATARQLEEGAETLERLLADYFKDSDKVSLVNTDQQEALIGHASGSLETLARNIGRQMGSDAVLISRISRYSERDGSEYSVRQPASVSFDLKLLDTATGQTICSSLFEETQQSLTENLLHLHRIVGRKFKWITAEELAWEGLTRKLGDCKYFKQEEPASPDK